MVRGKGSRAPSQVVHYLGCRTVWEAVQQHIKILEPRQSPSLNLLKLDISWMRTTAWVELTSPSMHHKHASFWSLASLGFPEARSNYH
ncbi:hypothetical protein C8R48DRAFT_699149 [Suillus tomentosus]|nr:hypothetical protein C8R48DRAFT_699149 [Suillus tomentosus]